MVGASSCEDEMNVEAPTLSPAETNTVLSGCEAGPAR